MSRTYTIGTRGSRLAVRQAEIVAQALRAATPGAQIELREIATEGDRSAAPLSEIGGAGVFTKAIEDALLAREIDIAVHSLKDLPPVIAAGLTIAAIPTREDARDALVTRDGRSLEALPLGARIGTGSSRRAAQLHALRGDIELADIRGNVDTRLRKVEDGEYDGAVLAMAGLERLGVAERAAEIFSIEQMLPAVGQGALAVQVRADDGEAMALVQAIDDRETHVACEAERAFLERLGAGCEQPVGAYASVDNGEFHVRAMLASEDGLSIARRELFGAMSEARALGTRLAEELLGVAPGPAPLGDELLTT